MSVGQENHDLEFYRVEAERWKRKFADVNDILSSTKSDLDEFQVSSKELEEELERELEVNERTRLELTQRVDKLDREKEEWKSKFLSLQNNYNVTSASLQRELDALRESTQIYKRQLVELEMGNDDLERSERAVKSSYSDLESKYNRALEDKILLEQELQEKSALEDECQRLKDEVRDLNSEVSVLKDQTYTSPRPPPPPPKDVPAAIQALVLQPEDDAIPSTPTLSTPTQSTIRARAAIAASASLPIASTLWRAATTSYVTPSPSRLPTASPRLYSEKLPGTPQPTGSRFGTSAWAVAAGPAKSRGISMVSDMRNKTKALQARIGTGLPRLRLNSLKGPQTPSFNSGNTSAVESDGSCSPGWVVVNENHAQKVRPATSRASVDSDRSSRPSPPPSAYRASAVIPQSYTPDAGVSHGQFPVRASSRLSVSSSTNTHHSGMSHASSSSVSTNGRSSWTVSTPSTSRPTTPGTIVPLPSSSRIYDGNGTLKRSNTVNARRSSLGPSQPNGSLPPRPPSVDTAYPTLGSSETLRNSRIGRPVSMGGASPQSMPPPSQNQRYPKAEWGANETFDGRDRPPRRRRSGVAVNGARPPSRAT